MVHQQEYFLLTVFSQTLAFVHSVGEKKELIWDCWHWSRVTVCMSQKCHKTEYYFQCWMNKTVLPFVFPAIMVGFPSDVVQDIIIFAL